ncbi:hypothetical protein V5799_018364, partial [Amblyomma americanum]
DQKTIEELRGAHVSVNWKEGEPPATTELLDLGKHKRWQPHERDKYLRKSDVAVSWKDGEPPALTKLLDCDAQAKMERRRAKIVPSPTAFSCSTVESPGESFHG